MRLSCPDKLRLESNVTEAVSAVYKLKDQAHDKRNIAASVWLNPARTAQRVAEQALRDHITEHGCMAEKY